MRIRTQLILAFILLAVLPLTAIVSYSYFASIDALQAAHRRETAAVTSEMDERMTLISESLGKRLEHVGAVGFGGETAASTPGHATTPQFADRLINEMGEEAELVDTLEIVPQPPDPDDAAQEAADAAAAENDDNNDDEDLDAGREEPSSVARESVKPSPRYAEIAAGAAPAAPAAPPAPTVAGAHPRAPTPVQPIVIDVDAILRSVKAAGVEMSDEDVAEMREDIRRASEAAPRVAEWESRVARDQARTFTRERARDAAMTREQLQNQRELERLAEEHRKAERDKAALQKKLAEMSTTLRKQQTLFTRTIEAPIIRNGVVVGTFKAAVRPDELMRRVFDSAGKRSNEVPFAIDASGHAFTRNPEEQKTIAGLPLIDLAKTKQKSTRVVGDWIVALSPEPGSGLVFGAARRIGEPLRELRQTAARNFSYGLALIGLSLIGVVPLANHITRDVKRITEGARRIAAGDLDTKLEVRSSNEVGQLAEAFNRMAGELTEHQRRLVEEERLRKEREIQQRLLEAEYDRKSDELEDARRFQLSLLPKSVPQPAGFEIAVSMTTATEVGGDYYDFHLADDGALTVAVGDAVGHGAKAGTMVTVIKSLFAGYHEEESPAAFLSEATRKIRRMDLGRMSMGLTLARIHDDVLTVSAAAMPPVLVHRPHSGVVEVMIESMPLGAMSEEYEQRDVPLHRGDTILLMSDGFPELANPEGQQLGYAAAMAIFAESAGKAATDVVAELSAAAVAWRGDQPPNDDVTFVVVRRV